jgi:NhaP-type Na+/H+ and K+/H+ antiporter
MIIKTLVISSLVVLSTHADDIIDKCDLNNNQVIETPKMYGVTNIGDYKNLSPEIKDLIEKERKCALFIRREEKKENIKRLDESIAEKNKNIAEKNKNIAKYTAKINEMKQLLAILSPEEAKKVLNEEIRKTEEKIIVEKDPVRKKTLNQKLKILKERLVEIDIKVG